MIPLAVPLETSVTDSLAAGPDPILSASVYCSGRLSDVIKGLLEPCWRDFCRSKPAKCCYVWVMRYARGGEHLKIRLHGPGSARARFRELLEVAQEEYFRGLGTAEVPATFSGLTPAPPIDAEDGTMAGYPDRILLWTKYCRNALLFGSPPFLDDDKCVGLLTRCFGLSTEILMSRLHRSESGSTFTLQRTLILEAAIRGLSVLPLSDSERSCYLFYHRDCLMRYLRRRKTQGVEMSQMEDGPAFMSRILLRFDQEIGRLGDHDRWAEELRLHCCGGEVPQSGDFAEWTQSLRSFFDYCGSRCGALLQRSDPFAESATFPLLFKALHIFANQVGVDQLNEALLYHILAGYASKGENRQRPVQLVPDL